MKKKISIIFIVLLLLIIFLLSEKYKNGVRSVFFQNQIGSQKESISCRGKEIPMLTEGPYYTVGSPERNNFLEPETDGTVLILSGYVLDTQCRPLSNVWLDFWQADTRGIYDNTGYRFRGHQYTDSEGKYILTTVLPGEYPGRTPHIHVKVKASSGSHLYSTQLFFPGDTKNVTDSLYDKSLEVKMVRDEEALRAEYNFVIGR